MFGCLLFYILECLLCFYAFIFVSWAQVGTTQLNFQPIFKQDEFIRNSKSKEILKYINLSADPCQDFYAFACGNWKKYYQSNNNENDIRTIQRILEEKVERDLQFILNEDVTLNDGFNGRKVKDFYKSCKNVLENGQRQQAFFSEFIKSNGGFPALPHSNWDELHPNYNWQEVIADLRFRYHMNILMSIRVESNLYNTYENTISLTEPETILPKHLCNTAVDQKLNQYRSLYEKIEFDVAKNIERWLSLKPPESQKIANTILVFELELCRGIGEEKLKDERNKAVDGRAAYMEYISSRRTLQEFTRHFNDSIDFYKFVSRSYTMPFAKPVSMQSQPFYQNLVKTIAVHDKATIANYIMYRALSILSFSPEYDKQSRASFCTRITKRYFSQVLGSMFYQKFANLSIKNEVLAIFNNLKIAFESSLRSLWLEEGTSRVGIKKLYDIVLHLPSYEEKVNLNNLNISALDYWHNLELVMSQPSIEERNRLFATENFKPSDEVEAYDVRMKYRARLNRIDVGWALLQPPFFQQAYSRSMLYATIGQKLGREIATAFNDLGWTSDSLDIGNWDHVTALAYQNRSECFRKQFSFYTSSNGNSFQNITELREVIAISGGINVAFAAYLNWLDFLNPNNDFSILRKETLPELNFTNTQLFFITYAQMHCRLNEANRTKDVYFLLHQYSLERYKVNGPLWNSVEFGRDFGCAIGTEMNEADKCYIY